MRVELGVRVLMLFTLILTANDCPPAVVIPRDTTVWVQRAFAGQSIAIIADSSETMQTPAKRQRATANGFVVLEMPAFAATPTATSVSFTCDAKADDDAFAPLRLRKLTHEQLVRDAGRQETARFEAADALLLTGQLTDALSRFEAIAQDMGVRSTGMLAALTALEIDRRLDKPATVAKHALDFWLARANRVDDAFADEVSYRGARAALAWRNYDAAFVQLSHHDRAHLSEMRRQALLVLTLREALTDAYLAQNDERVATLFAKYGAELIGDDSAWPFVTMASQALFELDLPNEALATFAHFDSRRTVVCSALLHLDAAVAAQQQDDARELVATLRPQARGQQKRRLEQLARGLAPSASANRTGVAR